MMETQGTVCFMLDFNYHGHKIMINWEETSEMQPQYTNGSKGISSYKIGRNNLRLTSGYQTQIHSHW